jgi:phosphatidylglycerophosphatase A
MMQVYRIISTVLGIGYIPKGGGTIASAICCLILYLFCRGECSGLALLLTTVFITTVGIWSASKMEVLWGKDNNKIVIDEVAGMCTSLLFVPLKWDLVVIGFVLFRFFDIIKPVYIRKLEKLPEGWGVMADDLLAGIYSNLILQCFVLSNRF